MPTLPAPIPLHVTRDGVRVPTVLWHPSGPPRGLVLACHGGSGHKRSAAVLAISDALVPLGFCVLAIDGPVHGERRSDGDLDPKTAILSFRDAWRSGVGRTAIAEDFSAALDSALERPGLAGLPIGYIGVSMGTAYGIPLLAKDSRIQAAAIGLWSANYAESAHLPGYARGIACPLWFTQQWDDEYFDREGTLALFDAIGSADKRLAAFPGVHRELEGERLGEAIRFVVDRLGRQAPQAGQ